MPKFEIHSEVAEVIKQEVLEGRGMAEMVEHFRHLVITYVLEINKGNKTHTANILKTHRNNLARWLKEAGK